MKIGNPNDPGDLVLLKELCKRYGLGQKVIAAAETKKSANECGAGKCSNDCTHVCTTCYRCPDNCSLKA